MLGVVKANHHAEKTRSVTKDRSVAVDESRMYKSSMLQAAVAVCFLGPGCLVRTC